MSLKRGGDFHRWRIRLHCFPQREGGNAASMIVSLPLIVVVIVCQCWIVRGIFADAVAG